MDLLELIQASLTPEELEIEYRVRGLKSDQVTDKEAFLDLLRKEQRNLILKPQVTHIKANPELELERINQQAALIDEACETTEVQSSPKAKYRLWIKTLHWKERAERLSQAFQGLKGLEMTINYLNRLARYLKRDAKRSETESKEEQELFDPKPSTSAAFQKSSRPQNPDDDVFLSQEFDKRFSNKIEELAENFLQKLQIPSNVTAKPHKFAKYGNTSRKQKNYTSSSESEESESFESFERYRQRENPKEAKYNNHTRRKGDPTKWRISFSGREERGKDEENVHDFLMKLEEHAKQDRIPSEELVSITRYFVKDKAEKWYYVYVRKNRRATWKEL